MPAALAPATIHAYSVTLAALDRWLADQGRAADDSALADYLAAPHDAGAAPSTIAMTVAAVKACARPSGQPSPAGGEGRPRACTGPPPIPSRPSQLTVDLVARDRRRIRTRA